MLAQCKTPWCGCLFCITRKKIDLDLSIGLMIKCYTHPIIICCDYYYVCFLNIFSLNRFDGEPRHFKHFAILLPWTFKNGSWRLLENPGDRLARFFWRRLFSKWNIRLALCWSEKTGFKKVIHWKNSIWLHTTCSARYSETAPEGTTFQVATTCHGNIWKVSFLVKCLFIRHSLSSCPVCFYLNFPILQLLGSLSLFRWILIFSDLKA